MRTIAYVLGLLLVVLGNHAARADSSALISIGDSLSIGEGSEALRYFGESLVLNNAGQAAFTGLTTTDRDGVWTVDYDGSVSFVAAEGGVSLVGVDEEETRIRFNDFGNVMLDEAYFNNVETTAFWHSDGSFWLPSEQGNLVPVSHEGWFLNDLNQYIIETFESQPFSRSYYVAGPESGVRLLIDDSDPAPDTMNGLNLDATLVLGHTDSGDVLLSARHDGNAGLYVYRFGESLAETIIPSSAAPEVPEGVGLGVVDAAVFSESGHGLALGRLQRTGGVTSDTEDVLYRVSPTGDISLIARKLDPAGDGQASFGYFGQMSINASGRATIEIGINDGTGAHFNSVWISEPDGSLTALLPAQSIEDADHFDSTMSVFGQVLVTAYLNTGGIRLYGLNAANEFEVVAEAGQTIEIDGKMHTISHLSDDNVTINDVGEVAFWAKLDEQAWTLVVSDQIAGDFLTPGDANLDGLVTQADGETILENLFTSDALRIDGDLNADGFVDVSDFNIWNVTHSDQLAAATVPEPNGMILGLVAFGLTLRRTGRVEPAIASHVRLFRDMPALNYRRRLALEITSGRVA